MSGPRSTADEKMIVESRWPRDRVRAKLRYARLLLEEVRSRGVLGDDFDYAHEEGCLAHLDGVIDAFLQEINICKGLGLELWAVTQWSIESKLQAMGLGCPEFSELTALLEEKTSWLAESREYRNHGIHRAAVSRDYRIVVGESSQVSFRNPRTKVVLDVDRAETIAAWIDRTEELFERLGQSLRKSCGLPEY